MSIVFTESEVDDTAMPWAVNAERIAELLGLSYETVRQLVHRERFPLPSIQPAGKGGRIVFPVDAVRAWLEQETADPYRARGVS